MYFNDRIYWLILSNLENVHLTKSRLVCKEWFSLIENNENYRFYRLSKNICELMMKYENKYFTNIQYNLCLLYVHSWTNILQNKKEFPYRYKNMTISESKTKFLSELFKYKIPRQDYYELKYLLNDQL